MHTTVLGGWKDRFLSFHFHRWHIWVMYAIRSAANEGFFACLVKWEQTSPWQLRNTAVLPSQMLFRWDLWMQQSRDWINISAFLSLPAVNTLFMEGSRQPHSCHAMRLAASSALRDPDSRLECESAVCGLRVWPCLWTQMSLNPKITFAYLRRWVMPAHAPLGWCLQPSWAETVIYCILPSTSIPFPSSPSSSLLSSHCYCFI